MSPALTGPYPITQGTAGSMLGTIYDANGEPVMLNLAVDVKLGIEPVSPALGVAPRNFYLRLSLDTPGRFAWDYVANDVNVAGLFRAQVHLLMPDGPKSFPNDGYLDIAVLPRAGGLP
jgi:hypothetical protein